MNKLILSSVLLVAFCATLIQSAVFYRNQPTSMERERRQQRELGQSGLGLGLGLGLGGLGMGGLGLGLGGLGGFYDYPLFGLYDYPLYGMGFGGRRRGHHDNDKHYKQKPKPKYEAHDEESEDGYHQALAYPKRPAYNKPAYKKPCEKSDYKQQSEYKQESEESGCGYEEQAPASYRKGPKYYKDQKRQRAYNLALEKTPTEAS